MQPRPSTLVKPTLNTRYHIDYSWWDRSGEDLRTYLLSHLPQEQRDLLAKSADHQQYDAVDPETGEVTQVDDLHYWLLKNSRTPDFITPHTSLVDGIFRVLIANNNHPMSSNELSTHLGRPAPTILKMLSGARVYKGIRPTENTT
ncbi:MAG: hypothetical protein L6Q98_03765 [Anaerolineae bacterium]|nr:hypothetical protein [Anaerolineae bacterium]NUQ02289.1 hypothetical protein [Anaerolineae bacterium]